MKMISDSPDMGGPPPAPQSPWDRMRWSLGAARENGVAGRVLVAIVSHANPHGKAWPSHRTIAGHVYGKSGPDQVRQVRRGISWLVEHGWLTVDPNSRRTGIAWTNVYQLRSRVKPTQGDLDLRQGRLNPKSGVNPSGQEGE